MVSGVLVFRLVEVLALAAVFLVAVDAFLVVVAFLGAAAAFLVVVVVAAFFGLVSPVFWSHEQRCALRAKDAYLDLSLLRSGLLLCKLDRAGRACAFTSVSYSDSKRA